MLVKSQMENQGVGDSGSTPWLPCHSLSSVCRLTLGVSVLDIVLLLVPTIENISVLGISRSDIYYLLFIFCGNRLKNLRGQFIVCKTL